MKITPMTEAEYKTWLARSLANYTADKMKANGLSRAEAEKIADDDFKRNLPEGLYSKGSFLYSAWDEEKNAVGYIWYGVRGPEGNKRAFILDVLIEEEFRGRGLGRQMMLLLEEEIKRQGLSRIGLHVFGYNEPAIRLYKSLGYATTDLVMEKGLQ